MVTLIDYYRVTTGLPWIPGGAAVLRSGVWQARYVTDEIANDARLRFRVLVAMAQARIDEGMDPAEVVTRAARVGTSGITSWQAILSVPNDATLAKVYAHYVEEGLQSPFPGASALEPAALPFG